MTSIRTSPLARIPRPSCPRRLSLSALVMVAALAAAPAAAQVNVEPLTAEPPPSGLSGSLGGDLTVRTGNVDLVQVGIEGRLYHVEGAVTTLMVGDGGIGFLGRDRFASSGLFHYREIHHLYEWIAPEWYGQMNYDRSQLLKFRALLGAGVRSPVFRGEWGYGGAGTGLMLEHEQLTVPDTAVHPQRTTAIRSSSYAALRLVTTDDLVVNSTTYIQPKVGDVGDLRVLEDFALSTAINQRMSLTVSFDLRYDSRPPDGIAALDTRLRTGLTLTY